MFLDSAPPPERRLRPGDIFSFSCNRALACFNSCCSGKHLPVTPYDIVRLKGALGVNSDVFLSRYTSYRLDKESGFPIISLRMEGDSKKACPFLSREGCSVYKDRPTACRLFPLARLSGPGDDDSANEEIFYMLEVKGCLGAKEKKSWSVEEWLRSQCLDDYIRMNDMMLPIIFHPLRERKTILDASQLQKVIVACYNLDVFREFVFETEFLDIYGIEDETIMRIERDDVSLLILAFAYLRRSLFR